MTGWAEGLGGAGRTAPPGTRLARVARRDGDSCLVLTEDGPARATLAPALRHGDDPAALPCAGDWVLLAGDVLTEVLPRRTAVVRRWAGAASYGQVLVANLDVAVVVEPLDPDPEPARIERLLALAWDSGADPVLVLTKADLLEHPDAVAGPLAAAAPGVPVRTVSAATGDGLSDVAKLGGPGRTLALLGPSGAGKSTLVNALAGTELMPTGATRADGRGRHTTSARHLLALPDGTLVVDTPGLRSIGLLDGATGLELAFPDIAELALTCRYTDCAHEAEPGCAVLAARDAGDLPPRRLRSWRTLSREQRREAARLDERTARDAAWARARAYEDLRARRRSTRPES